MRRVAALLLLSLVLAGCAAEEAPGPEAPEAAAPAPAPVAPAEEPATGSPAEPLLGAPATPAADGRASAAQLLPLALAYADAWRDDATLVQASSRFGENGLPLAERKGFFPPPQPLDGRDALWGFAFVSARDGSTLVVRVHGDGGLHSVEAEKGAAPARPAPERPLEGPRAAWAAWLETDRLPALLAEDPEAAPWLATTHQVVGYEIGIQGSRASARVDAWDDREHLMKFFEVTSWAGAVAASPELPRSTPAPLLEAALAWARAWDPAARLDHVEGVVGDGGITPPVGPPTRVDGKDSFWHFAFGRPGGSGMTVTVSATGEVVKVDAADPETVPREPARARAMNETEARWERALHSERLAEALAGHERAAELLEGPVDHVRYIFGPSAERPSLMLMAGRGSEYYIHVVSTTDWKVVA